MLFESEKLVSKQEVLAGVEKMNSFGVRTTGSGAQRDFVSYLRSEKGEDGKLRIILYNPRGQKNG